jgi:hypothetical protein
MKFLSTAALFVVTLSSLSTCVFAQSPSREQILKEIQAKRTDLQRLEKQYLSVSDEDRAPYADFLAQPDTGLIRLLPREIYDSETYRRTLKGLTIRGGGAYYSFTRLTHEYGYGSDIELSSGYLSVGFAGLDYGMLLKLGDVPLEDISLESLGMQFISTYSPPSTEPEVRQEQRRFSTGATVNEVVYRNRLPVETKTTFLLRSISYDRTDVLVAFRVIKEDTDGSVIVLWKLLKKYPAPALATNKPEAR